MNDEKLILGGLASLHESDVGGIRLDRIGNVIRVPQCLVDVAYLDDLIKN